MRPLNIGSSYLWKKASSREHWRSIVDAAIRSGRVCDEDSEPKIRTTNIRTRFQ